MDEAQYKALLAMGYQYSGGIITDADGNYVESVDIDGNPVSSLVSKDIFDKQKASNESIASSSEAYNNIEEIKKNPTTTPVKHKSNDIYDTYAEEQLAKGEKSVASNLTNMVRAEENKAFENGEDFHLKTLRQLQAGGYESVIPEDHINKVKANNALVRKYQETDKDYVTHLQDAIDNPSGREDSFIGSMMNSFWGFTYSMAQSVLPHGTGMEGTEEEKKEYKEAKAEEKRLKKPAAEIMGAIIAENEKKLLETREDLSYGETWTHENRMVEFALGEIQAEKDRLEAFKNDSWVYNPFNKNFAGDIATMGIGDAYDQYNYVAYLHEKINSGEELTEKEQMVAETLANIDMTQGLGLDQRGLYSLTEGTAHSASFMVGGLPGRVAMKGVTKSVTAGVTNKLAKTLASSKYSNKFALGTGKVAGESTNMLGQMAIHPATHTAALDKYYGSIHFDVNDNGDAEITTDRKTYATLMREYDVVENKLAKSLAQAQDPKEAAKIQASLEDLEKQRASVKAPETAYDAIMHGMTETLKENLAENYGGALLKKVTKNRWTDKLLENPWAKSVKNSAIGKGVSKVDNAFKGAKKEINSLSSRLTGKSTATELVGSNFEEMFEEVLVQATPVWGETEEEAALRKAQLFEASFYAQVAGQTMLMGAAMKPVSLAMSLPGRYKNREELKAHRKELKKSRREYKNMMNEFKKTGVSPVAVEDMLMSIGKGNLTVQDYNNRIDELREEGTPESIEKSMELEKNKNFNTAKSLIKMGKGNHFIRNAEKILSSGNISQESAGILSESLVEAKALNNEMKKYDGLKNRDYILELHSSLRYNKNQIEGYKKEISKLNAKEDFSEIIDQAQIDQYESQIKALEGNQKRFEKILKHETSSKKVEGLRQEAEMTSYLNREFQKASKKETKNKSKQDSTETTKDKADRLIKIREEIIDKAKKKFGITVGKTATASSVKNFKSATKNLDTLLKLSQIEKAKKEAMEKQEASKKPEQVPPVETEVDTNDDPQGGQVDPKDNMEYLGNHIETLGEPMGEIVEILPDPDTMDSAPPFEGEPAFDVPPGETQGNLLEDEEFEEDLMLNEEVTNSSPFKKAQGIIQDYYDNYTENNGVEPTFEDYIDDLLIDGQIDFDVLKNHLRILAGLWSGAGLGRADFKKVYNELLIDPIAIKERQEIRLQGTVIPETPVKKEIRKREEEEIQNKNSAKSAINVDPHSGAPIHVSENKSKTFGVSHTIHYSATEYEHEVKEEDGKRVYVKVSSKKPKLRLPTWFNFKHLVNPNKNNMGDKLKPKVLSLNEAKDVLVPLRDEYGRQGVPISYDIWKETMATTDMSYEAYQKSGAANKTVESVTFEQWVNLNIGEQSFEDFQKTDLYIGKVPMGYEDSNGDIIAPVTEVEWYSPTSVGDRSLEEGQIDLDNLSESHKKDIEENKAETLTLRKQILSGEVTEVEITDNLSNVPNQMLAPEDADGVKQMPLKLNEVAPESTIVWMNSSGQLVDLDGNIIDVSDVLNYGDSDKGFARTETVETVDKGRRVRMSFPVNMNKVHYLTHTTTVDGKKKYLALTALRKDENGQDSANQEDVETARWIVAINNVTKFSETPSGSAIEKDTSHPLHMTLAEAEDLREQIKEMTGLDVKYDYASVIEAMISFNKPETTVNKGGKSITEPAQKVTHGSKMAKDLLAYNRNTGEFNYGSSFFSQNTFLPKKNSVKLRDKPVVSIKRGEDGKILASKVKITEKIVNGEKITEANNYDDFLRERMSTNVIGYNVGTAENPVYTHAVQQTVIFTPIVGEIKTPKEKLTETIEENKKSPKAKEKVEETTKRESKEENLSEEQKAQRDKAVAEATALAEALNIDVSNLGLDDNMVAEEMSDASQVRNSITAIPGITGRQEEDIISWVFARMAKTDSTANDAKMELSQNLTLKIEELNSSISALRPHVSNPAVNELFLKLVEAKNQNENVLESLDRIVSEASQQALNSSFITDEYDPNAVEQEEKDYSKASNETKGIDKVGTALKRIFAQVTNGEVGFMGLEGYASFKQMYDYISLALATDVNLRPNFNEMMDLLEQREESTPWMKSLIKAFRESDEQTKNQFVYNLYKQKINAKFAMLSYDKDKNVDSQIYDSNANEAQRTIIEKWKGNFKRSPINNEGVIDKEELVAALDEWDSWFDNGGLDGQTDEVYKKWLGRFGIVLSDGAWEGLRRGELNVSSGGSRLKRASFSDLFTGDSASHNANRSGMLFTNLKKYASLNFDAKKDLEFYENLKNHPYEEMGTILKQLAELENKYNPVYNSTSRYVDGKSVSEVESFTYFYEQFNKIKRAALSKDKKYLKDLMGTSFAKDSRLMKLMIEDDVFARQFDHGMVDLMSLKEAYKKSPMFAGIDKLSATDYMFVQRTFFQDRRQGSETAMEGTPFKYRMAQMNTLTNSDKGRMMLMKTAVFDFYKQSEQAFVSDTNGELTFTEDLQDMLYSSMVMPELRRMVNFITKIKETNIKSYDQGAVRFNLIPEFNTILNKDGETVQEVIERVETEFLENNDPESENFNTEIEREILQTVESEFKSSLIRSLELNVVNEAKQNVKTLADFEGEKIDGFNNKNYLSQREGSVRENMFVAEVDFILNSMLTNMNYMQMMPGDPALYYKGKGDERSKDLTEQTNLSQSLAINLGKRMAAMIAPGSVLPNSHNNEYIQVFLEDVNGIADNILDIVGEWHYTKEELNAKDPNGLTYKEMFEATRKGDTQYVGLLQDKFDKIAEFIEIESTDAQEMTTTAEHMYILRQQGRIPKNILDKIDEKLEKQKKFIEDPKNAGKPIPEEIKLNTVIPDANAEFEGQTELNLIMQPIKPVYTGTILDETQDVNRMMYVKSSSFPLVPELTIGRDLDNLRINMEKVEQQEKKTVRASYQTANKVGGLTKNNTIKSFSQPILPNNTLTLKREHFKIQQDVPFKSKKVQDDTVSMGTQIFKLLMGDGIMEMDGFQFEGETYSGKELQEKFHSIFSKMVTRKKEKFLNSVGVESDGTVKNKEEAIEKLRVLLTREAKSRGFSKQDLKILSLVEGENGESTFKLPLWLTGNSDKYESMLNAMINNKIFKQKIPGNKFVTASETGFQVKEGIDSLNELAKSRIVHLGNFKGGTLQSTRSADKTAISKAQVLLPSKFKLGGKLIDLFKNFDGESGTYLETVDGIVRIKEDMIDKQLLEQFVFRIPTSSHGLGSSVEVAGFLPPEAGDLIITPKSFVAQMGQDFDVDSLTAYQYNHLVMENGEVKMLNEENKEAYIKEQKEKIERIEKAIKSDNPTKLKELDSSVDGLQNLLHLSKEDALNEIAEAKKNLSKDFEVKLLENQFIQIHNSVYTNPKSQAHINKVLSMSSAEKQADDIEALTTEAGNTFNILSPKYQMNKMNAGSTGQDAIGIYAKGVTMHSLTQQAKSKGEKIRLGTTDREGREIFRDIKIGRMYSDGVFGKVFGYTPKNSKFVSLARRISTALDERTNTGTDNEKAQILGRTGLNSTEAIAVDAFLISQGIDMEFTEIYFQEQYDALPKDKKPGAIVYDPKLPFHEKAVINGKEVFFKKHSIPYLLHSQPIIKELFALVAKKKSIVSPEFAMDALQESIDELIEKYKSPTVPAPAILYGEYGELISGKDGNSTFVPIEKNASKKFTGEFLERQIKLGTKSNNLGQLQVLALYSNLIVEAKAAKKMSEHADLNNLGKSMWESTTKAKDFREFFHPDSKGSILNVSALVGDIYTLAELEAKRKETVRVEKTITKKKEDPETGEEVEVEETVTTEENAGFDDSRIINLGQGMYLDPKTNQGVMVGTALSLSESLFSDLFPAKNKYINDIIDFIIADSKVDTANSTSVIKAKEQIFQEMKKFLLTSKELGLFNKSAKEVRNELMKDDPKNGQTSLSSYINNLLLTDSNEYSNGLEAVKGNIFLQLLKTPMGENGKPSIITFNNQESFDVNQEAIYAAVKELIANDLSLPPIKRNGVSEFYSTRKLAQDLIAYSYVSGGIIQGALEFHKFLPIEYLDAMSYKNAQGKVRTASETLRSFNKFNSVEGRRNIFGKFVRQYFQHNPDITPQAKMKATPHPYGGETLYTPIIPESSNYFSEKVKTRSKLKQDKWVLYERIGESRMYRKIDVLGDTGVSEYAFETKEVRSNFGESAVPVQDLSALDMELLKMNHASLGEIPESGSTVEAFLAEIESGEYGDYENIQIIAKYLKKFIRPGETFSYETMGAKGSTRNGENMRLNLEGMTSREDLAVTFLHEALHIASSKYVNNFLNKEGELLEGAPKELISLNHVFGQYKDNLKEKYEEEYLEFERKLELRAEEKREFIEKGSKDKAFKSEITFTPRELSVFYPTKNLKEFIAVSLSNNKEFKKEAKKMKYLSTDKSILRKFGEFFSRLIAKIAKNEGIETDSIAANAMEKSFSVIEASYLWEHKSKEILDRKKKEKEEQDKRDEEYAKAAGVPTETFDGPPPFDYGFDGPPLESYSENMPGFEDINEGFNDVIPPDFLPLMKITKNKCK